MAWCRGLISDAMPYHPYLEGPLWVMCGRLRFGKVYFGCKLVECCHVSGLLLRSVFRWP